MDHTLQVVLETSTLRERIRELGREITANYQGEPLVCVCVLKGAFLFFADLLRHVGGSPEVEFIRLASYKGGTGPSGRMSFTKDVETDLKDKHVLIVEDIVDTGRSMDYLLKVFRERGPRSLKICALVDKYERREVDVAVDFPGFRLEKGFLVGYGLDYQEMYRELDAVYELVFRK